MKPAAKRVRPIAAIRRARGILKRKPGDKPFAEQWAEHKREELALEERRLARFKMDPRQLS